MVSSISHVLRGNSDPFTILAAGSASYVLYSILARGRSGCTGFFLAAAAMTPLLLLPDYKVNLSSYLPSMLQPAVSALTSPTGAVGIVAALVVAKLMKMARGTREHFLLDTSAFASFKLVGKKQEVEMEEIGPLVNEMREVFKSGYTRPYAKRIEQLKQLKKFMVENEQGMVEAIGKDLGRPEFVALMYEVFLPVAEVDEAIHKLEQWMQPEYVGPHILSWPATAYTKAEPMGVALIIGTWNFPFQLELVPLIGAIAAGNASIVKPCNTSKACSRFLADHLHKYMDPKCVQVVGANFDGDRHCTAELLKHEFDVIFFTGSPSVGRVIMEGAAKHLTRVILELGGKNPVYVDKDVDIELAAKRIVWGRCLNGGQQCIAPDYVLCHKDVIKKFEERCAHYCKALFTETPVEQMAHVVGKKQFERLVGLLNSHGGKVVSGGKYNESKLFIEPTVVSVARDSELMQEETFGPILAVTPVDSVREAVSYIQGRPKPLALYVFTNDDDVKEMVVSNTSSGGVTVNNVLFHVGHPALPFGGVGNSGMGNYHGKRSFSAFSHEKPILEKAMWKDGGALSDPFFIYPPYTSFKQSIARALRILL